MIDIILSALAENNISVYRINEIKSESEELFFVKKQLNMNRSSNVHLYEVTVFCDFLKNGEQMRGSSSVNLYPTMDKNEIFKALKDAYYAASYVCNKYYKLADKVKREPIYSDTKLSSISLSDAAVLLTNALYSVDTMSDAWINSAELFVEKISNRIISSEGTDVSYTYNRVKGEFVTQCTNPSDVELYTDFSYDDLAVDALAKLASEALETVKARSKAKTAPNAGTYDIILSDKNIATFLSYYTYRSNAAYIYPGYSNFKVGENVQKDIEEGEKLNLSLASSVPYSFEGVPMYERTLIKDGELKLIHGNVRFCRYLEIEPTGSYNKVICSNGTISFDTMKKQPYLYVVSFSDFQMDPFSGHYGGEIRLAYLFDGNDTKIVTGGSINGNIFEAQKHMLFSTDRYSDNKYEGPFAVKIPKVNVAGV